MNGNPDVYYAQSQTYALEPGTYEVQVTTLINGRDITVFWPLTITDAFSDNTPESKTGVITSVPDDMTTDYGFEDPAYSMDQTDPYYYDDSYYTDEYEAYYDGMYPDSTNYDYGYPDTSDYGYEDPTLDDTYGSDYNYDGSDYGYEVPDENFGGTDGSNPTGGSDGAEPTGGTNNDTDGTAAGGNDQIIPAANTSPAANFQRSAAFDGWRVFQDTQSLPDEVYVGVFYPPLKPGDTATFYYQIDNGPWMRIDRPCGFNASDNSSSGCWARIGNLPDGNHSVTVQVHIHDASNPTAVIVSQDASFDFARSAANQTMNITARPPFNVFDPAIDPRVISDQYHDFRFYQPFDAPAHQRTMSVKAPFLLPGDTAIFWYSIDGGPTHRVDSPCGYNASVPSESGCWAAISNLPEGTHSITFQVEIHGNAHPADGIHSRERTFAFTIAPYTDPIETLAPVLQSIYDAQGQPISVLKKTGPITIDFTGVETATTYIYEIWRENNGANELVRTGAIDAIVTRQDGSLTGKQIPFYPAPGRDPFADGTYHVTVRALKTVFGVSVSSLSSNAKTIILDAQAPVIPEQAEIGDFIDDLGQTIGSRVLNLKEYKGAIGMDLPFDVKFKPIEALLHVPSGEDCTANSCGWYDYEIVTNTGGELLSGKITDFTADADGNLSINGIRLSASGYHSLRIRGAKMEEGLITYSEWSEQGIYIYPINVLNRFQPEILNVQHGPAGNLSLDWQQPNINDGRPNDLLYMDHYRIQISTDSDFSDLLKDEIIQIDRGITESRLQQYFSQLRHKGEVFVRIQAQYTPYNDLYYESQSSEPTAFEAVYEDPFIKYAPQIRRVTESAGPDENIRIDIEGKYDGSKYEIEVLEALQVGGEWATGSVVQTRTISAYPGSDDYSAASEFSGLPAGYYILRVRGLKNTSYGPIYTDWVFSAAAEVYGENDLRNLVPEAEHIFDKGMLNLKMSIGPSLDTVRAYKISILDQDYQVIKEVTTSGPTASIDLNELPQAFYYTVQASDWASFQGKLSKKSEPVFVIKPPDYGLAVSGLFEAGQELYLAWNEVPSAMDYEIQISRDADFSTVEASRSISYDQEFRLAYRPQYEGEYYFRIQAKVMLGMGYADAPWSESISAAIAPREAIRNVVPVITKNEKTDNTTYRVDWNPVGGADRYIVHLQPLYYQYQGLDPLDSFEVTGTSLVIDNPPTERQFFPQVIGIKDTADGPVYSQPSAQVQNVLFSALAHLKPAVDHVDAPAPGNLMTVTLDGPYSDYNISFCCTNNLTAHYEIKNANGTLIDSGTARLNNNGTLPATFRIDAPPVSGDYTISLNLNEISRTSDSAVFQVQPHPITHEPPVLRDIFQFSHLPGEYQIQWDSPIQYYYTVEYSKSEDFSGGFVTMNAGQTNRVSVPVDALDLASTYYLRVKASLTPPPHSAGDTSPWSNLKSIETPDPRSAFESISPVVNRVETDIEAGYGQVFFEPVEGAVSYRYDLTNLRDGTVRAIDSSMVNHHLINGEIVMTVPQLEAGDYAIKVLAVNEQGWETRFSEEMTFTMQDEFELAYPTVMQSIVNDNAEAEISWRELPGATSYRVRIVSANGAVDTPVAEIEVTDIPAIIKDLPKSTYFKAYVQAVKNQGGTEVLSKVAVGQYFSVPLLSGVTPEIHGVSESRANEPITVQISREGIEGAQRATYQIFDTDGALVLTTSNVSLRENGDLYEFTVNNGLSAKGDYRIRVLVSDNYLGTSRYSEEADFTVLEADDFNQTRLLLGEVSVSGGTIHMDWPAHDRAVSYEVQVSSSADFFPIVWRDITTDTTDYTRGISLQAAQNYYIRVRASKDGTFAMASTTLWSQSKVVTTPDPRAEFEAIKTVVEDVTATDENSQLTFQVDWIQRADRYQYEITRPDGTIVKTAVAVPVFVDGKTLIHVNLEHGEYSVRVRGVETYNGWYTEYSDPVSFEVTEVLDVPAFASATFNNSTSSHYLRVTNADADAIANAVYEYEILDNLGNRIDGGSAPLIRTAGESLLPFQLNDLNGSYKIRVREVKGNITSAWSEPANIASIHEFRNQPVQITAADVNSQGVLNLTWEPMMGAESYTIYIKDRNGLQLDSITVNSGEHRTSAGLEAIQYNFQTQGTFRIEIHASTKPANNFWDGFRSVLTSRSVLALTGVTEPLAAPRLAMSEDDFGRFKLNWEPVDGAAYYTVELSRDDPSFRNAQTVNVQATEMNLSSFAFGMYFYRVKAVASPVAGLPNESPWSNTRAYNFGSIPFGQTTTSGRSARSVSSGSSLISLASSSTSINSGALSAFAAASTNGGTAVTAAPIALTAAVKPSAQSTTQTAPLIQSIAGGGTSDSYHQNSLSSKSSPYTAAMIAPIEKVSPTSTRLSAASSSVLTRSSYSVAPIVPVKNAVNAYYRNSSLSQSASPAPVRITAVELTRTAPAASASVLLPRNAPSALSTFRDSLYRLLPVLDDKQS